MPNRPPRPCTGCHTLTHSRTSRCPACTSQAHRTREARRGNRHQRGYTYEYQQARRQVLTPDATCHWCGARATVTDHLLPLSAGGTNDITNLVPACTPCNSRRTTR